MLSMEIPPRLSTLASDVMRITKTKTICRFVRVFFKLKNRKKTQCCFRLRDLSVKRVPQNHRITLHPTFNPYVLCSNQESVWMLLFFLNFFISTDLIWTETIVKMAKKKLSMQHLNNNVGYYLSGGRNSGESSMLL